MQQFRHCKHSSSPEAEEIILSKGRLVLFSDYGYLLNCLWRGMEEIEQVWYQYIEKLFNRRNLELVEVLFSSNYVLNGEVSSHAQIRANLQTFFNAFPDCYLSINEQFKCGVCIISTWTLHGTHLEEFRCKSATGIRLHLYGKSEAYIHRGKIVKQWREMDDRALDEQLKPA